MLAGGWNSFSDRLAAGTAVLDVMRRPKTIKSRETGFLRGSYFGAELWSWSNAWPGRENSVPGRRNLEKS